MVVPGKAVIDIGCITTDPGKTSTGASIAAGKAKGSQIHQVKRIYNQGKIPVCNCGFYKEKHDCRSRKKMQSGMFRHI